MQDASSAQAHFGDVVGVVGAWGSSASTSLPGLLPGSSRSAPCPPDTRSPATSIAGSLCIDACLCPGPWPPRFPKSRAHLSKGEASHPHFGHSSLVLRYFVTPTRSHPAVLVPPPPAMLCRCTRPGHAETASSRCQRASSGEQSLRGKSIQLNLRESKKKGKHREQMNLTRD